MESAPVYKLYYWPSIQGRGEFVRLVFEEAGQTYVDVARLPQEQGGGAQSIRTMLEDNAFGTPPFAPPVLRVGELQLAQTAAICRYVAQHCGLMPANEDDRWRADQLMITIMDHVVEAHDTHHPIANSLNYEEQLSEARQGAEIYLKLRVPKALTYFERILSTNGPGDGKVLLGAEISYVDLALFQLVCGLQYAFPKALAAFATQVPLVMALRQSVADRPRIAAYLNSSRRIPFNQYGIFRHYPELDSDA